MQSRAHFPVITGFFNIPALSVPGKIPIPDERSVKEIPKWIFSVLSPNPPLLFGIQIA